jgi:hypothetical protein
MILRVYVDFNTMMQDPDERVAIHPSQVTSDFRPGMRISIADETLEVEGTLEFDRERRTWLVRPDWPTQRDLPYP